MRAFLDTKKACRKTGIRALIGQKPTTTKNASFWDVIRKRVYVLRVLISSSDMISALTKTDGATKVVTVVTELQVYHNVICECRRVPASPQCVSQCDGVCVCVCVCVCVSRFEIDAIGNQDESVPNVSVWT